MKSLHSNNLGKTFLVEECQKIRIKSFLKECKSSLKQAIVKSELDVQGKSIPLTSTATGNGGCRYFFICPRCSRRVGVLFNHPLLQEVGCRLCLGLEYKNRRYKGMIESRI